MHKPHKMRFFLYFIVIRGEVTAAAGLVAWSVVGMHTQEP